MTLRRSASALAAASLFLLFSSTASVAVAAPATKVMAQLPQVIGPIPVTPTSRPFLGAKDAMEAVGYVEEEFFLSGRANVYDWVGSGHHIKVVAGPTKYVTRILVRRPREAARFSGNVEVNVLNASGGIDAGGPIDFRRMVDQGDVWVGITTKSLTADALKRFDPVRYARLDWANPAPPAARCADPTIIPAMLFGDLPASQRSMPPEASNSEDGLVWDMLGQLGLLLKSEQRTKILPSFGKAWVYMDGGSQSAIYMRTWMAGFHDRYRTPDGRPVYDGYLAVVGPALLRVNQCAKDVPLTDPRQKLAPPDVPFISLSSEGEMWQGAFTHQPDVFTAKGGLVTYEVAGGSHGSGEVPGLKRMQVGRPSAEDVARSGVGGRARPPAPSFIVNDFVWAPITRGAYRNLQLWVRQGIRPPQAPGIEVDAKGAIKRDSNGNALGGVRLPYIEVPVAAHTGYLTAGGFGGVMGSKKPFPPETLKVLYPDHATYVAKFSAATDKALAGRWISPEDAAAMKKAAQAAPVPDATSE